LKKRPKKKAQPRVWRGIKELSDSEVAEIVARRDEPRAGLALGLAERFGIPRTSVYSVWKRPAVLRLRGHGEVGADNTADDDDDDDDDDTDDADDVDDADDADGDDDGDDDDEREEHDDSKADDAGATATPSSLTRGWAVNSKPKLITPCFTPGDDTQLCESRLWHFQYARFVSLFSPLLIRPRGVRIARFF
jgi:hypothetical protein